MLLSRQNKSNKTSSDPTTNITSKGLSTNFQDYIKTTDFSGALAILKNKRRKGISDLDTSLWIAYCYAHLGNYEKAKIEYENIRKNIDSSNGKIKKKQELEGMVYTLLAVCNFMLGYYEKAKKYGEKGKLKGDEAYKKLAIRVLFHTSQKVGTDTFYDSNF